MEKNKYRIVTDGDVFRIEVLRTGTYRAGLFFLKKVTYEIWIPCDNVGNECCDDNGWYDDSEIVEYESLDLAKAKVEEWIAPVVKPIGDVEFEPEWNVVWQQESDNLSIISLK